MTDKDEPSSPPSIRARVDRKWLEAVRGKTIRFTFHEGPTKGSSFDHSFHDDGTVSWRDSAAAKRSESSAKSADADATPKEPPTKYGSFQVADDVYVVSYLSKSGYTLTLALNFETDELFGFASNDESWYPVRGIFEMVD